MLQKTLIIITALLMLNNRSFAQCDTSSLAPDSLQIITYGTVKTIKKYQDTLYVGGSFTMIGKYTGSFIGIDTLTGYPISQPTWPKSNGDVLDAVSDGGGGWVIVGDFTMVGDDKRINLAQINSSSQVTGLNISVNGVINVALVNNGILYIGGTFSTVNSNTRNNAAAINLSTGTLTTWDPNCNGEINALATDGSVIYIGGAFTNVGGNARARIAALNATTGIVTSWVASISNNEVLSIVVNNNKIFVGGTFTSPYNRLVAFDKTTGSNIGWNPNSSGRIQDMVLIRNQLYVAGTFTTINSINRSGLAAIDTLTGVPNAWNPSNTGLTSKQCLTANGSNIYVGGGTRVAIIDTLTAVVKTISPNVGGVVYTVASAGNKVFAGGAFSGLGLTKRSHIAGINMKDWSIIPFTLNLLGAGTTGINDIEIDNGKMYIGGNFYQVNSNSRSNIASLDMTNNYSLLAFNPNCSVLNDMVVYGANIYVVGTGTFFAKKIDKISGAIDASWSPLSSYYANSDLYTIKQMGNDLFMGGGIRMGSTTYGFLKHNLSTGVNTAYNFNNPVNQFAVDANKVYCTGIFYGQPLASPMLLESLNINPLNDNSWHPNPNYSASAIEVDKGRVYVGGSNLNSFNSIPRDGLAIVDTLAGSLLGGWHPGVSGGIYGFLPLGDTLYTYGNYGTVSGKRISNITRFHFNYGNPTVTIAPANNYVCANTNTTFTATITPTTYVSLYKWKKNGVDVGTNSQNYSYTPVTGDVLTCTVNHGGCYIDRQTLSASYTVTTTPNTPLTASITATANPVCIGTAVTYTATSSVNNVSYQWVKSSNNISGATSSTYTYTPTNGNSIRCIVTAPVGCYSPTQISSNQISMTVKNYIQGTSLTGVITNPICQGSTASFNANTSMNSGGNPTFQWKVNGLNAGTNNSSFSYIANNNDNVVCEVTATTGCFNPNSATSTPIVMNVNPNITPTISISGNSIPDCEGTPVTYIATANPVGTYQWKVNGSNVGNNKANHSYIPAIGDLISCGLTVSTACLTSPNATSNTLTANLTAKVMPTISINAVPMAGLGANVTVNATVTNAGNNYTIDWKNNGNLFSTTTTPFTTYVKAAGTDNISAEITPQGCYINVTSSDIIVQMSTSVQEVLSARGISVFPNPFLGHVFVKGLNKGDKLSLYDLTGRKTGHDFIISENDKEQKLQINDMTPGIYMLYITDGCTNEIMGVLNLQKR